MLGEGRTLVVTMVGGAVVTVVLVWTLVVYGAGGRRRRRLDPLVSALLVLASLRQAAMVARSALGLFRPTAGAVHYCGLLVWSGASVSTLQGGVVATLGLCLAARAAPRYSRLVTRSHLAYHLVSAALLSSCVGVAAVLATGSDCLAPTSPSDPRYSLFSLALNTALALVATAGLLASFCLPDPLPSHPSTSDLSSLSSRRTLSDASLRARHYLVSQLMSGSKPDLELMSTTSSTNSRAYLARPRPVQDVPRIAVVAILLVSLASNQIPILTATAGMELWNWRYPILTKFPDWSTLAEGILLPLVLFLADRAFLERLSKVYSRPKPPDFSRPPQGAYGKFMARGSMAAREATATPPSPVRFPITNGSLFASLDARTASSQPLQRRIKGGWYWAGRLDAAAAAAATTGAMGEQDEPLYASLSAKSACSATTQANSDFEFFCNRPAPQTPTQSDHLKIDTSEGLGKVNLGYRSSLSDEHGRVVSKVCRMNEDESSGSPTPSRRHMHSHHLLHHHHHHQQQLQIQQRSPSHCDLSRPIGGSCQDVASGRAANRNHEPLPRVCRVRSTGGSQAARPQRHQIHHNLVSVLSMDSLVANLHGRPSKATSKGPKWDSVPDLNRSQRVPTSHDYL